MTERVENGKKVYAFGKGPVTKTVFWVLFATCIGSLIAFIVLFATGSIKYVMHHLDDGDNTEKFLNGLGCVLIAVLLLFFIPVFFEKICKLYIPNYLNILLYTMPVFNLIIGHGWGVFYMGFQFDTVMHAYNGFIFVVLGISVALMMNKMPMKNVGTSIMLILFFAFCFSLFIEYVWEIFEYTMDGVSHAIGRDANMQMWQDSLVRTMEDENGLILWIHDNFRGNAIIDTIKDMLFHLVTTFITCAGCFIYMKKKKDGAYKLSILSKKQVAYFKGLSGSGLEIGDSLEKKNEE